MAVRNKIEIKVLGRAIFPRRLVGEARSAYSLPFHSGGVVGRHPEEGVLSRYGEFYRGTATRAVAEGSSTRGARPRGGGMTLPTSLQKRPGEQVVDLDEARHDLRAAEIEHDGATQELAAARSKETAARNRLNQAQKRFDYAVESIKARAPRDSDWGRDRTARSLPED